MIGKAKTGERLGQIVRLLAQRPKMTRSEIAHALHVGRSTVFRSLPMLEEQGVRLVEDDQGRLSLDE